MSWKRSYQQKLKLKKLSKITSYPSGVYYIESPKPYYKRYYRYNHKGSRYSFYKKYANRQIRQHKDNIVRGGSYKKCFDYWWTVN